MGLLDKIFNKKDVANKNSDIESKTTYDNYKLEYLNNNGVFYKYKVLDFTLPTTDTRIYEISNILLSQARKILLIS